MFEPIYRVVCQIWQQSDNDISKNFSIHLNQFALESFVESNPELEKDGPWYYTGVSNDEYHALLNADKKGILRTGPIPKKAAMPKNKLSL